MKTKFLSAAFLLLGISMSNAQVVQSSTETGVGTENGAYQNATTNGVFVGYQAGKVNTGVNNTMVGHQAGLANTTFTNNSLFGAFAGSASNAYDNTYIGNEAGRYNQLGEGNVTVGSLTMSTSLSTTGSYNTVVGFSAGKVNRGGNNVFVGTSAGANNANGGGNVAIGFDAGRSNVSGSQNIFIGQQAGYAETGSHKLYVANTNTTAPPIYGDLNTKKIAIGGFTPLSTSDGFPTTVGGASVTGYRLFVKGGILTDEVRVATTWADYVFADNYSLPTLTEVEMYIKENGHLPNVPSAKIVESDGIEVGEMAKIHQEKIEELTLYAIEQNKQIEAQKLQLEQQQKDIDELKASVKALMNK